MPDPIEVLTSALAGLKPGKALDLAAGSGRHSRWLAERGWDVTAVDIEIAIEIGEIPGVHCVRANLEKHEYTIAPGSSGSDRLLALLAAGSAAGDRGRRA